MSTFLQSVLSLCQKIRNFSMTTAYFGVVIAVAFVVFCRLFFGVVKLYATGRYRRQKDDENSLTIGLFHPYCDAGGGGERVLWCGIRALSRRFPAAKIVVYTGDLNSAPDQILERAKKRFDLDIDNSVEFVYLHRREWVEAKKYPYFTLLGQSFGSIYLAFEALDKHVPDIYLDTMGYAFTLPVFKWLGRCKVGCYVHYPTISTDMLAKVRGRAFGYNNRRGIASSKIATNLKLLYYKFFAWLYGKAGQCSDLVMVNSSWTEDHISTLWRGVDAVHKIYPPCDVKNFKKIRREFGQESMKILSLGQFRPEKDHAMQIRALFELRQILAEDEWERVKLVIIGGCRNAEDERRVQDLEDLCKHFSIEDNVEFKINIPFEELHEEMANATMGIHTMWNEHFGIAVVEMMAAGLITLAHRSGGPLMDIIIEDDSIRNGFLAIHDKEYAEAIAHVMKMSADGRQAISERAQASVDRFSEKEFESGWIRATEALVNSVIKS